MFFSLFAAFFLLLKVRLFSSLQLSCPFSSLLLDLTPRSLLYVLPRHCICPPRQFENVMNAMLLSKAYS
ncbi:hypothetical protein AAHE18_08G041400 [Arachis hypogaea]